MQQVLLDFSFLAHRAHHALKELEHEDQATGVLYGFFEQLRTICKDPVVASNQVHIFTDSKASKRKEQFPDYKKKRHEDKDPEELARLQVMYDQINLLAKKLLPQIGFPVYKQEGLESDDLIAYAAKELTRTKERGIIVTADGDLYQCISSFVSWYDPQRNKWYQLDSFFHKKNIAPSMWGIVKAIGGCPGDGVPGLKGVSEKGAIQYLNGELQGSTKHKRIQESSKEIDKWGRLTILPHADTQHFDLQSPKYNSGAFFDICKHYGIISYLEEEAREQWRKFFQGHIGVRQPRRREA